MILYEFSSDDNNLVLLEPGHQPFVVQLPAGLTAPQVQSAADVIAVLRRSEAYHERKLALIRRMLLELKMDA